LIEAAQALFDRLGPKVDVEGVLGDIPGDARHFCWSSRKNVLVTPEEVDELAFLFGAQAGPDLDGLGWILNVDLYDLGILNSLEGARHGGHGWVG
jgi:hypothetical protein